MLYDYPEYYEIAFSFRDLDREAQFFKKCIDEYSLIDVDTVFELACGPAPHTGVLASMGYRYMGLDINRIMIDHAHYKWRDLKPSPKFVEGNMLGFDLGQKVDFAFVMLGSLYLHKPCDLDRHFDAIASSLNPGGLYFLDGCVQFGDPLIHQNNNAYTIARDEITICSSIDIKLLEQKSQTYEEIWTIDVDDHGKHIQLQMIERNRAIFADEFSSFIDQRPDFELAGFWRDWDLNKPIQDNEPPERSFTLLRRI